jgi:hypothetical protein
MRLRLSSIAYLDFVLKVMEVLRQVRHDAELLRLRNQHVLQHKSA